MQTIEHKDVSPFEDYTMRALAAGIESQDDIEAMLGLDRPLLEATLVGLAEQEAIELGGEPEQTRETVALTDKGSEMLASASSIQSSETVIEIDYDGLLREPVRFLGRFLEPRQLARDGIREIPPHPARAPTEDELRSQLEQIAAVIRATGGPRRAGERAGRAGRPLDPAPRRSSSPRSPWSTAPATPSAPRARSRSWWPASSRSAMPRCSRRPAWGRNSESPAADWRTASGGRRQLGKEVLELAEAPPSRPP